MFGRDESQSAFTNPRYLAQSNALHDKTAYINKPTGFSFRHVSVLIFIAVLVIIFYLL